MKLENAVTNPDAAALVAAAEGAKDYPDGMVVPCPLAKKKEKAKPALRVLVWHVRELGGGFQSPEKRADECIQAYAKVAAAVKPDAWILLGLSSQHGWKAQVKGGVVTREEGLKDTGVAEAKRILEELKKADGSADWKLAVAMGSDDKPAYDSNHTACFFYRGAKSIACEQAGVTQCGAALLAVAPLTVPDSFDVPPDLALVAPMFLGRRKLLAADAPPPGVTVDSVPECAVIGFSSVEGLGGNGYADFRSDCDVEYAPPLTNGTKLKIPYWEAVAERDEALLENYVAVNAADVVRQNKAMHWEAIKKDKDPQHLDKVVGRLADSLLVRCTGATRLKAENVRVVDLVRGGLKKSTIAKVGQGNPLDEDAAIAALLEQEAKGAAHLKTVTPETTAENQIAAAALFARRLSDHWPVVADVRRA